MTSFLVTSRWHKRDHGGWVDTASASAARRPTSGHGTPGPPVDTAAASPPSRRRRATSLPRRGQSAGPRHSKHGVRHEVRVRGGHMSYYNCCWRICTRVRGRGRWESTRSRPVTNGVTKCRAATTNAPRTAHPRFGLVRPCAARQPLPVTMSTVAIRVADRPSISVGSARSTSRSSGCRCCGPLPITMASTARSSDFRRACAARARALTPR